MLTLFIRDARLWHDDRWQSTRPARAREARGRFDEAATFFYLYAAERRGTTDPEVRLAEAEREVDERGFYTHTPAELEFGARAAWRNANRCIGRLYWRSLVVRDKRHVHDSDRIAEECIAHLHSATNRGRIRRSSRSSPPDEPDLLAPRLRNPQLIRYAGRQNGVGVIGDGAYVEFTLDDDRSLWKDRALVELNLAVLWSFDAAGAKIADHHGESQRFMAWLRRRGEGRPGADR